MYSMKQVCTEVGMPYETLKFYCNEGLIPNVKRNEHNYRMFDDKNVAWIKSLTCLKDCGMSIIEMKEYLALCMEGEKTIPERKEILHIKRNELVMKLQQIQENINYIDKKQKFYDDVVSGTIPYFSNLLDS